VQPSAERLDAFAHAYQAVTAGDAGRPSCDGRGVVGHLNGDLLRILGDGDSHGPGGRGVAGDVGERLLNDPVDGADDFGRPRADGEIGGEAQVDRGAVAAEALDQLADRLGCAAGAGGVAGVAQQPDQLADGGQRSAPALSMLASAASADPG
jgi:hypothetical protein